MQKVVLGPLFHHVHENVLKFLRHSESPCSVIVSEEDLLYHDLILRSGVEMLSERILQSCFNCRLLLSPQCLQYSETSCSAIVS